MSGLIRDGILQHPFVAGAALVAAFAVDELVVRAEEVLGFVAPAVAVAHLAVVDAWVHRAGDVHTLAAKMAAGGEDV